MGWIGGGDGKLAAVTAVWFGFSSHLVDYLVTASLFGGVLTILLLMARAQPVPVVVPGYAWLARLLDQDTGIPYGIALALAALSVYANSPWMIYGLA